MEILFTAFAIVAFLGTAICAAFAYRNAQECSEIEDGLRRHIGRIAATEAHCESLEAQLQKLRGKFYATQQKRDEQHALEQQPLEQALTERERLRREHASDIMPAGVKRNGG